MSDSPRPVRTMPAANTGSGHMAAGHSDSSTGAARFRADLPLHVAGLTRAAALRAVLVPLALSAVLLPMHAARRVATHPAAHATGHAAPHAGRGVARLAASSHPKVSASHRATEEEPTDLRRRRGKHRAVAAATRPMSRRERETAAKANRHEAFAALWDRAGRAGTKSHEVAGNEAGIADAVPSSQRGSATSHLAAKRQANRETRETVPSGDSNPPLRETAATTRTEDRVHAWYKAHHPAAGEDTGSNVSDASAADVPGPSVTPAANSASSQHTAQVARPDLAPTARKATAADFARAAAAQRDTIAAVRAQQAHQTTADDDDAEAQSRIPETAPTAREPLPFVHGNFGDGAVLADSAAGRANRQAANVATPPAAPIVREAAPTIAAVGIHLQPPEHLDLKHRGDGLNTAIAAEKAGAQAGIEPRAIPEALAADSSPRAIRELAQQASTSPTPVLKLPAPPTGAMRKEQPAVALVESGAKRRDLSPAVVSGMAEETFDGDDAPAPARTAVALAAPTAVAGLQPVRTHLPAAAEADSPATLVSVNLFDRDGRLILVPPMKGSHEILVHQNQMAVNDGLDRIQDDGDLLSLRQRKLLVALPDEDSTYPDDRLPAIRRYARPWTVRFLRDLAKAHYARFGTPLIVTSAARTVAFQRRLVRTNGNAAPPTGDIASPHLYGQAIDIGKGRMNLTELTWMRAYLTPVENDGKIDVEEEFQQSCFHISVYRRYLGLPSPQRTPAPAATMLTAKDAGKPENPRAEATPGDRKRRRLSTAMLATGLR